MEKELQAGDSCPWGASVRFASEQKVKEQEQRMAGGAGHRPRGVVVAAPGDGWRLFHVARCGARTGEGARPRCLRAAADIYLQALEWLWAALAGPDAAAIKPACVPPRLRSTARWRGGTGSRRQAGAVE